MNPIIGIQLGQNWTDAGRREGVRIIFWEPSIVFLFLILDSCKTKNQENADNMKILHFQNTYIIHLTSYLHHCINVSCWFCIILGRSNSHQIIVLNLSSLNYIFTCKRFEEEKLYKIDIVTRIFRYHLCIPRVVITIYNPSSASFWYIGCYDKWWRMNREG